MVAASTSKQPAAAAHDDSTARAGNEDDDDGTQLTYNETIDALCSFITTAVHTILCHRQLYPPSVFVRRQRFRVPVWASRHPGLNAYIDDVVGAIKTQLQRSLVRSVHMVLTSSSTGAVLERYRFDVDFILRDVPVRDRDFSIPGNMNLHSLELHLRAFMMKLISLDGALYDIEDPEDVTWALVLDMKKGCHPQTSDAHGNEPEHGLWVPFTERHPEAGTANPSSSPNDSSSEAGPSGRPAYLRASHSRKQTEDGQDQDDALIVPVKSLDTGVINLMLYVEEHPRAKRRSLDASETRTKAAIANARLRQPKRGKAGDANGEGGADDEARYGERDIDEPLQQPSSSGVAAKAPGARPQRSKKQKSATSLRNAAEEGAGRGEGVDETAGDSDDEDSPSSDDSRGSSGSADSIRSVNDFAGYGKGPGGVGMSGIGM